MALEPYRRKRNFRLTPEPSGKRIRRSPDRRRFAIQKHAASHLHYDFRLELDGVLLSWAVPKGPSLDPGEKRLAIQVEDHPVEYGEFEGTIPAKQYGAGTVMLWDRGTWATRDDPRASYRKGALKFMLHGEKLHGGWALVKTRSTKYKGDNAWLLIKERDRYARTDSRIVEDAPNSVVSGQDIEGIARTAKRVWHSNEHAVESTRLTTRRRAGSAASKPPGAKKSPLPAFVHPELATLMKAIPKGGEWLHEMKFDGYRMLCRIDGDNVALYSRNRNNWTGRFPGIARGVGALGVRSAWIDGEVVMLDQDGHANFQALQNALSLEDTGTLQYYAFDLMYFDGYDLRNSALVERKKLLEALLESAPVNLHYSAHVVGLGDEFLSQACALALEGVMSKRAGSHYVGRRTQDWVKTKCGMRQEMVIGGFTDPGGTRSGFGALLLGVYEGAELLYSGKVGTGFNATTLRTLRKQLDKLATAAPPFSNPPSGFEAKGVHWVRPALVAEIAFAEWTNDSTLRHGSFQGLRTDKRAEDIVREQPAATPRDKSRRVQRLTSPEKSTADAAIQGIALTHPEKVLYEEMGLTKRHLAHYYEQVAEVMLPHLRDRPLMLVRCPAGWNRSCFHQKHADASVNRVIDRAAITGTRGRMIYMMANSVEALIAFVQMGVLELHPWGGTASKQSCADRLIFDLDPDDSIPWAKLIDGVKLIRVLLAEIGLQGFLKTTGGKGLHVVVPIRPTLKWAEAKSFTKAIAELMATAHPDRFTARMSKKDRDGRIFIDYLRNARDATAVALYSTRARKGGPVATPIAWAELKEDVRFAHFNVNNVPVRVRRKKDPWPDFFRIGQTVTSAMRKRVASG